MNNSYLKICSISNVFLHLIWCDVARSGVSHKNGLSFTHQVVLFSVVLIFLHSPTKESHLNISNVGWIPPSVTWRVCLFVTKNHHYLNRSVTDGKWYNICIMVPGWFSMVPGGFIPHIRHRHHRRCLCKNFLSGEKNAYILLFQRHF